jgi:hypothetical protein
MRKKMYAAITAVAIGLGSACCASAQQATGDSGAGREPAPRTGLQGFSVPNLLFELSLFLPQGAGSFDDQGRGNLFRPKRDPGLFFTAGQAALLLPLMQALRNNPYPTPSAARKLLAAVDDILTAAQKKARDGFRADSDRAIAQAGRQAGTGQFQNLQNMSPQQQKEFLDGLPADQRARIQARLQQQSGGPRLGPLERRQRVIDAFIRALRERAAA